MFTEFFIGSVVGGAIVAHIMSRRNNTHTISNTINGTTIKGSFIGGNDTTRQYIVSGNSISIDSQLIVDGKVITDGIGNCTVNVTVEGDCHDLRTGNGRVDVRGSVMNDVHTSNGRVDVKNGVGGNVTTSNGRVTVTHGSIKGNVKTTNGRISSNK